MDFADLNSLRGRLERIHLVSMNSRPKQAVGEMIDTMLQMPEWGRLGDAIQRGMAIQQSLMMPLPSVKDPGCFCARCDMEVNVLRTRMSICPECGDKRCPRAEDHCNECRKTPNVAGNRLAEGKSG